MQRSSKQHLDEAKSKQKSQLQKMQWLFPVPFYTSYNREYDAKDKLLQEVSNVQLHVRHYLLLLCITEWDG